MAKISSLPKRFLTKLKKAYQQRKKKKTLTRVVRVSFPNHIIFEEILSRLPVKTLIRFKSVSKSWYSTISSHDFAKSHLKLSHTLSSSSSYQFIILTRNSLKFMLMPYDDKLKNNLKNPIELGFALSDPCFDSKVESIMILVGCCDGLVCLICRFHIRFRDGYITEIFDSFIICNPSTHQWFEIAMPSFRFSCYSFDYWFGYVRSADDYKIVTLLFIELERLPCFDYYVYSMRTGKWKRVDDLVRVRCKTDKTMSKKNPLVFHDVLYWSPRLLPHDSSICAFDFVTEQVKQVPAMGWLSAYNVAEFFVANGCLGLCCFSDNNQITDVWMMKQHDDWSSWEKSRSIHDDIVDHFLVVPTGTLVVYNHHRLGDGGHYLYEFNIIDIRKDSEEECQYKSYISSEPLAFEGGFVESLVPPFAAIQPA